MNSKHRAALPATLILLTTLSAHAVNDSCGDAPWQVAASIERIEPRGGSVQIEPKDGSGKRQAVEYECLRAGDRVVFMQSTTAVELFIAGNLRRVSVAESPFVVPGGGLAKLTAAMQALMDWWRLRPRETGAAVSRPRTRGDAHLVVTPVKGLATSRVQNLLPDMGSAVIAWRSVAAAAWGVTGGCLAQVAPPRATESDGGWFIEVPLEASGVEDCALSVIDDSSAPVMTLALRTVNEPPAPSSLKLDADWRQWTPGDRIAWAAWALQRGPAEWHLQALTWLHQQQAQAWLAGHLFYRTVNGSDGGR